MVLTLIAEVLSGETLVTPAGAIDMATACGLEAFTWESWLDEQRAAQSDVLLAAELAGIPADLAEVAARRQ